MLSDQEIGAKVELARHEMKLTQTDVANQIGVTTVMISRYERGINIISPTLFQKLSHILKKPVSYFFGERTLSDLNDLIQTVMPSNDDSISSESKIYTIPLLTELFPSNVLEQIKKTTKKYKYFADSMKPDETYFAIRTSDINAFDIDVAIDTTLIVSLTHSPINGDKVILVCSNEILIRNYFRIKGIEHFPSSNPMFKKTIPTNAMNLVGTIVGYEKIF